MMRTEESEYQKIGRRIRTLRISRGMTQVDLARELGVTSAGLSCVERGKSAPTVRKLFRMSEILRCSMRDFFEDRTVEENFSAEEILGAMRAMREIKLAEAREK